MALVTVVVPTFRRPAFLVEALASLERQSFTDFEALVCDNAAQEETRLIVERLDARFRYQARPRNVGLARNAVLGFAAATTPLVMKLDDDDALTAHTLAALVRPFVTDPATVLSFGRLELVDAAGDSLPASTRLLDERTGRDRLRPGRHTDVGRQVATGAVNLACALFRHDAVDWAGFPMQVDSAYDLHIALCLAVARGPAWFAPAATTRYRLHARADTAMRSAAQGLGSLAAKDLALAGGRYPHRTALLRSRESTAIRTARALVREQDTAAARRLLREILDRRRSMPLEGLRELTETLRLYLLTFAPPPLAAAVSRTRGVRIERRRLAAADRRTRRSLTRRRLPCPRRQRPRAL